MEAPAKSVAVADGNPKTATETPRVEDYKDAAMYYGTYPAYLYGGDALLSFFIVLFIPL